MIISFSGLDGSGKTTMISMVADQLKKKGLKVKLVETYSISLFSIMGRMVNFFSRKSAQHLVATQFSRNQNQSKTKKILSCIRILSFLIDIILFTVFIKLPANITDTYIICDRYFFDALIQLYYLNMCSEHFFLRTFRWIPLPDLSILLLPDPHEAYKRKPEYDLDYFLQKDKLYNQLTHFNIGCHSIPSLNIEESNSLILQLILAKIPG